MTDSHCGGCGKELIKDELLRYGWSCEACEQAWLKKLEILIKEIGNYS